LSLAADNEKMMAHVVPANEAPGVQEVSGEMASGIKIIYL
jgi:hypothetical protein